MPLLHKSFSLATLTCCVAGMCCAELSAQSTQDTPRRSSSSGSGSSTVQQRRAAPAATRTADAVGRAPLNDDEPERSVQQQPVMQNRSALQNGPAVQQRQRPVAQPLRIPKLTAEMEDILKDWEKESAKITRLEGTFTRITYDKVFSVEQVSDGKYCFEFPDRGSFHQKGKVDAEGKKGFMFLQKPGPDERWVCDGTRILKIDDKAEQYQEVSIPPEDRGQNIKNSPLPFLFGMKADEAKQRYYIEINKEKTTASHIMLKVKPLEQKDLVNYTMAEVMLDRTNFLPTAVKLYDTTGNKEDVYLFNQKAMIVNGNGSNWKRWFAGDPLKPDLRGYKKLIAPENAAAPQGQRLIAPAAGRGNPGVQPAGVRAVTPRGPVQKTAELPPDDERPARRRLQP